MLRMLDSEEWEESKKHDYKPAPTLKEIYSV